MAEERKEGGDGRQRRLNAVNQAPPTKEKNNNGT